MRRRRPPRPTAWRAGLRLGEALARCPTLRLVTPDPAGVADEWDRLLAALEGIGAAVEPGSPGSPGSTPDGLRNLYGGGSWRGCINRSRRSGADARRLARTKTRIRQVNATYPGLCRLDADRSERRLDEDSGGNPIHAASRYADSASSPAATSTRPSSS